MTNYFLLRHQLKEIARIVTEDRQTMSDIHRRRLAEATKIVDETIRETTDWMNTRKTK